jgi:hypothetical protein
MTIKFNCPYCNALIAFDSKHAGKRARCQSCQQLFFIPSKTDEKPKKFKTEETEIAQPIPGFYRAVFVESWKIFNTRKNATPLVFVAVLVCIKFFLGYLRVTVIVPLLIATLEFTLPLGIILTIVAWAGLFWYYMQIIYATAFEAEELPEVHLGGLRGLVWNVLKLMYTFFIMLFVVELPYIIAFVISKKIGAEWSVFLTILKFGGLFFFPMAILTVAIGKDFTMLRPDYILIPVFRAFKPYLVVAALLIAFGALVLEMQAKQLVGFAKESFLTTTGYLFLSLFIQVIAIIAMRAIGLFYRHYTCYLPW